MDDNPARSEDVWRVVDSASFGLFGRRLPMGSDWSLVQRRYVELVPYAIGLAVGVGRRSRVHEGQPQPWAWLRLPDAATFSWVAQSVVERLRPGETSRDQDGLWLPLRLPTEAPGSVMIQEVRAQIETIGNEIRHAIDQAVERELDPVAPKLRKSVTAVLGMPPIDPADLLDDSPTRRADIELILCEAARSFFDGKINPSRGDDDYLLNRYIRVETLDTHVSPSIGRLTRPAGHRPHPWAWLRVHEDTSRAEIALRGARTTRTRPGSRRPSRQSDSARDPDRRNRSEDAGSGSRTRSTRPWSASVRPSEPATPRIWRARRSPPGGRACSTSNRAGAGWRSLASFPPELWWGARLWCAPVSRSRRTRPSAEVPWSIAGRSPRPAPRSRVRRCAAGTWTVRTTGRARLRACRGTGPAAGPWSTGHPATTSSPGR
jgi:hypothetical protein